MLRPTAKLLAATQGVSTVEALQKALLLAGFLDGVPRAPVFEAPEASVIAVRQCSETVHLCSPGCASAIYQLLRHKQLH